MPVDDAGAWTLPSTMDAETELAVRSRRRELEIEIGKTTEVWFARRPLQTESLKQAKHSEKVRRSLSRKELVRIVTAEDVSVSGQGLPRSILDVEVIEIPSEKFDFEGFFQEGPASLPHSGSE